MLVALETLNFQELPEYRHFGRNGANKTGNSTSGATVLAVGESISSPPW